MNQSKQPEKSTFNQVKKVLEKRYGTGAIMLMGDQPLVARNGIPTGSHRLDMALGIGGYPRGRVVEIFGPEASGKTTLTLHAIASCQREGGVAAFVDVEHALDPGYAAALGVDIDKLIICQPDNGEQALDTVKTLLEHNLASMIVVDSVAALVPRAEMEGQTGDIHVGTQARLMNQSLRQITPMTQRSNTTVIFINQLRQKIGVTYGSNEVTSGGNALKYYASLRLDVRRIGLIKEGNEQTGARTRVRVKKNKLAPPFRSAEFDIVFGKGIDTVSDLLDLAVDRKAVRNPSGWYAFGERRIGHGRTEALDTLRNEPELCAAIRARIDEGPPQTAAVPEPVADSAAA